MAGAASSRTSAGGRCPRWLGRVLASRVRRVLCGAIGVALLGVVVYTGSRASQTATANFAPTFVYVIFWLGAGARQRAVRRRLPGLQPLARDRPRRSAGCAQTAARGDLPAPLAYPERLGHWPAAAGLFAFAALELVASNGDQPENLAIATLVYSALTFVAMALYGVEAWSRRGEAFSVYFNLFSRISPVETPRRRGRAAPAALGARRARGRRPARWRCWR